MLSRLVLVSFVLVGAVLVTYAGVSIMSDVSAMVARISVVR
jgi:hypothetical protein